MISTYYFLKLSCIVYIVINTYINILIDNEIIINKLNFVTWFSKKLNTIEIFNNTIIKRLEC